MCVRTENATQALGGGGKADQPRHLDQGPWVPPPGRRSHVEHRRPDHAAAVRHRRAEQARAPRDLGNHQAAVHHLGPPSASASCRTSAAFGGTRTGRPRSCSVRLAARVVPAAAAAMAAASVACGHRRTWTLAWRSGRGSAQARAPSWASTPRAVHTRGSATSAAAPAGAHAAQCASRCGAAVRTTTATAVADSAGGCTQCASAAMFFRFTSGRGGSAPALSALTRWWWLPPRARQSARGVRP
jgi:hypothetical protein